MIETVKKFILATNGVWPDLDTYTYLRHSGALPSVLFVSHNSKGFMDSITFNHNLGNLVLTREEYETEAFKMGFVNGYRWGVEYLVNSKKPNLPNGCKIQLKPINSDYYGVSGLVDVLNVQGFFNSATSHFKITDQRYKPADTSYLDAVSEIPESKYESGNVSAWWDYEAQKAVALPPVGDKSTSYLAGDGVWIGCEIAAHYSSGAIVAHNDGFTLVYKHELRPNNFYNRKAEAEKKRVVDAVVEAYDKAREDKGLLQAFNELYDAGFLRMPEDK